VAPPINRSITKDRLLVRSHTPQFAGRLRWTKKKAHALPDKHDFPNKFS